MHRAGRGGEEVGTGWVGGTHHASPAVPAEEAVTFFQQLYDVELVVVVPNVGLVQGTVVVFMHLWPDGVQCREGRLAQATPGVPGWTLPGIRLHWGVRGGPVREPCLKCGRGKPEKLRGLPCSLKSRRDLPGSDGL